MCFIFNIGEKNLPSILIDLQRRMRKLFKKMKKNLKGG